MNKKKLLIWIIKFLGASCVVFLIMTCFSFFYYNPGVHITSENGASDYVWESGKFYSRGNEGFAYGTIDNNGYNNSYPSEDKIDILLMGSSHMEAFNVMQDENTCYRLNKLFADTKNPKYVYNIGISGHNFLRTAKNIRAAAETFKPEQYIIMETDSVKFKLNDIESVLNGQMKSLESYDDGLMYYLQKNPFVKLLYVQYENTMKSNKKNNQTAVVTDTVTDDTGMQLYEEHLGRLMNDIQTSAADAGCRLIIFYHPPLNIEKDGSLTPETDDEYLTVFKNACEENNIIFVDMTQTFLKNYEEDSILPYGFGNTKAGSGHLNKNGHKLIADELFSVIENLEK